QQRTGPLPAEDVLARRIVLPEYLARVLVQAKQTWRLGGRQRFPFPISAVASGYVNPVAIGGGDGATEANRHRMARGVDAEVLHHVEFPSGPRLARAAPQRADVEADRLSPVRHEIQAIALHQWRTVYRRHGPVHVPTLRQPWRDILPEELAIANAE